MARVSPRGSRTRHRLSLLFHDGGSSRGNAENAGLENAGLKDTGTSCVWVAKCNIINVRGHVRVNVTAGRGGPAYTAGGNSKRNDEETQTIFRCLLSLPLLPVGDIAPGFHELKSLPMRRTTVRCVW